MIVVRTYRPTKRPFNSPEANVAAAALQQFAGEQFQDRQEVHWMVARAWQQAINRWQAEAPEFWPPATWGAMRRCETSLLWTPRLVRRNRTAPKARFCRQCWLCPFCYGRELVKFLRPFVRRKFQIRSDRLEGFDRETLWSQSQATSVKLTEEHGSVATWRYIYRSGNVFSQHAVWLFPGPHWFTDLEETLIDALAYPYPFLECRLYDVADYINFMGHHRGRGLSGHYRTVRQGNQSDD